MRLITSALLISLTIFSTGCEPEIVVRDSYDWYTPVKFSDQTKTWIRGANPPQFVWDDLEVVAKNNDKHSALKELDESLDGE